MILDRSIMKIINGVILRKNGKIYLLRETTIDNFHGTRTAVGDIGKQH